MALKLETLELASMALNAKVAECERYPSGTSGHKLKLGYTNAMMAARQKEGE